MLETLVLIGGIGLGAGSIVAGWSYQTKSLNKEYGPKFEANLARTEEAIKNRDYERASQLFEKRKELVTDSNKQFEGWLSFAKPKIKANLERSHYLEEHLDLLRLLNE